MLSQPAIAILNHLLAQSGWALQRLARFVGRTVHFRVAPFSFSCTVQEDGSLREVAANASADASCTIPPSLLPRLALQDEKALEQVKTSGDGALIEEIFFLVRNLRWDAAEDLSHVTGDIAAERIVGFARDAHKQVRGAALNLSQALTEYWTEERPLLAKPQQITAFGQEVSRLHDEAEKLEQRIQRLSKAK
jgi:ubiquinone biosynthesis protein UbiJ